MMQNLRNAISSIFLHLEQYRTANESRSETYHDLQKHNLQGILNVDSRSISSNFNYS